MWLVMKGNWKTTLILLERKKKKTEVILYIQSSEFCTQSAAIFGQSPWLILFAPLMEHLPVHYQQELQQISCDGIA